MRFITISSLFFLLIWCGQSLASQEIIRYPSEARKGKKIEVEAELSFPEEANESGRKSAAVILLHSNGGWKYPVTGQYAEALTKEGFIVLEPHFFDKPKEKSSLRPLPMVYDALQYLASRSDIDSKKIGIAGFSYGGYFALLSATSWAQDKFAKNKSLKFASHAPFYPVCWDLSAFIQGKVKNKHNPDDVYTKWTGAPIKIFAGGKDDYDDRDPNACSEFVSLVPASYQSSFSVKVYPEATHGWDQPSISFYRKKACKGKGCKVTNKSNPEITKQSISELVEFFKETLSGNK